MLIEAPHAIRLLVDGGGFYGSNFDTGRSVIGPFLLAKKIVTLDYVINTHPHQDHLVGHQHVLQYFKMWNFASGPGGLEPGEIRNTLNARKVPASTVQAGDALYIGGTDVRILVSIFLVLIEYKQLLARFAHHER